MLLLELISGVVTWELVSREFDVSEGLETVETRGIVWNIGLKPVILFTVSSAIFT